MKIRFESQKIFYKTRSLRELRRLRRLRRTSPSSLYSVFQSSETVTQEANLAQSQEDFSLEPTGWLGKNADALALVKIGITQAKEGKVKRMSFADCADLEIED